MLARSKQSFAITRAAIVAVIVAVAMPMPASAQSDDRLRQIESQINALQRAVFPGGDDRFFEPEITPERATTPSTTPQVTTSALTDVLARLDAIEGQLARLTATAEVSENALAAMEMRMAQMEARGTGTGTGSTSGAGTAATAPRPSGVVPVPGEAERTAELPAAERTTTQATAPTPERVAAVQAIAKPATGDQGDDEYVYGFRLWDAGFFPEAQQQLAMFVERYPDHWRTTYGRNLLGRAFLDAGEPRAAATHFFENYQSDAQGARAPDSLLYLADSMITLGDTRRACIALAEFGETYAALAVGRLQNQYDNLGGRVDCN